MGDSEKKKTVQMNSIRFSVTCDYIRFDSFQHMKPNQWRPSRNRFCRQSSRQYRPYRCRSHVTQSKRETEEMTADVRLAVAATCTIAAATVRNRHRKHRTCWVRD